MIFTSQPNVITDSDLASLYPNLHHQSKFGNMYLKIKYHLQYKDIIWCSSWTDTDHIARTIVKALLSAVWSKIFRKLDIKFYFDILFKTILFPQISLGLSLMNFTLVNWCQFFLTFARVLTLNRSSHRSCSIKKMFLKISQNSQETSCARASFLIKLQAWGLQLY